MKRREGRVSATGGTGSTGAPGGRPFRTTPCAAPPELPGWRAAPWARSHGWAVGRGARLAQGWASLQGSAVQCRRRGLLLVAPCDRGCRHPQSWRVVARLLEAHRKVISPKDTSRWPSLERVQRSAAPPPWGLGQRLLSRIQVGGVLQGRLSSICIETVLYILSRLALALDVDAGSLRGGGGDARSVARE